MTQRIRPLLVAATVLAAALIARQAVAGPPLICFPFDIGTARSLPMGHANWHDTDPTYDTSHLVADTLALLAPITPVNVRMETLRRATVYLSGKPALAHTLLLELQTRAAGAAPLAAFDYGYLVESLREAGMAVQLTF